MLRLSLLRIFHAEISLLKVVGVSQKTHLIFQLDNQTPLQLRCRAKYTAYTTSCITQMQPFDKPMPTQILLFDYQTLHTFSHSQSSDAFDYQATKMLLKKQFDFQILKSYYRNNEILISKQ